MEAGIVYSVFYQVPCIEQSSSVQVLTVADQEIGVFRHVAQPTRLRLDFPRETGLILRFAGKSGNPFQTKQGNRPSCRHQEGRRGSAEAVLGTFVFSSSETGVSGKFWGRIKGSKYHFTFQDGTWDFPWDAVADRALIFRWWRNHIVFLQLPRDSWITTGNTGFLLCWPREVQSSIRVARESWGLHLSQCRT